VLAIDVSDKTLEDARGFVDVSKGDIVAKVDAQNVLAVLQFVNEYTRGTSIHLSSKLVFILL